MPLTAIFARHHLKYHTDDTQLYVDFSRNQPCEADIATRRIEACTTDIKRWMTSHQLLLNETKTKTIVFYARNARALQLRQSTCVGFIFLDSGMDMSMQIARTYQGAYLQLHNIAKIHHCLTIDACKTIVHGLVTSKLDFGNAVFCGINGQLLQKLQRVQSWVARVTYAAAAPRPPSHHASADSATLAADSMAHNIQDTGFDLPPEYIADTITEYTSRRSSSSSNEYSEWSAPVWLHLLTLSITTADSATFTQSTALKFVYVLYEYTRRTLV